MRALSHVALLAVAALLSACGAKSDLREWNRRARDLGVMEDMSHDAGPPLRCVDVAPNDEALLPVDVTASVRSADVMFLMDATGSMFGEISVIRRALQSVIIPGLRQQIPDLRLSVGAFADYPFGEFGEPLDVPFVLYTPSTTDPRMVQLALDRFYIQAGGDLPEAHMTGLYAAMTDYTFPRLVRARNCPAGTFGHPCFPERSNVIIVVVTDAPIHNGPTGYNYTDRVTPAPPRYAETLDLLRARNARVVGIYSGLPENMRDIEQLARDTGAVRRDGTPIVQRINSDGVGLDARVVDAVTTLVRESRMDVELRTERGEPTGFDARLFVRAIEVTSVNPRDGVTITGARVNDVTPGTQIAYAVRFANAGLVPRGATAQVFLLDLLLIADDASTLQQERVRIVVPGLDGTDCSTITAF